MRYIIGFCIALVFCSCSSTKQVDQPIKVRLYPSKNDDRLLGSTKELIADSLKTDHSIRELAKVNSLDTFLYTFYSYDPESYAYMQSKNGEIDSQTFKRIKDYYAMPDSYHLNKKYNAETYFLVGKRGKDDCIIIADKNNNNRLDDDSVYVFKHWFSGNDSANNSYQLPVTLENLMMSTPEGKIPFTKKIKLQPLRQNNTILLNNARLPYLGLILISSEYLSGSFKLKGTNYRIAVRNLVSKYSFDSVNTIISIASKKKPFDFQINHDVSKLAHIGDRIALKKGAVKLTGIETSGNFITLQTVSRDENKDIIVDFKFNDFTTQKEMSFTSLFEKNEYLLMDFWGSWCQPCIKTFPELKELYDLLSQKGVSFLGVIYDGPNKKEEIHTLLQEQDINWPQMFIADTVANTLIRKLNIESYPTYIVADRKGKIVYRDFGLPGLQRLKNFLHKKIL